jgi:TolB-like protein/Tfp pilus assembly protein PilF
MAIYMSAALTAIGIVRIFIDVYDLPRSIFLVLVTVLICGVGSALVFAWYHGMEGAQKFTAKEFVLHALFLACAVFFSLHVVSTRPVSLISPNLKSIAVLPFTNMSENKEDEYFSDGITDDIITQLSRIADLSVISRTSVMKYKNTTVSVPDIARDLNVGSLLEGSVRRANGRVRITSQLIDARADKHLWAETYDRDLRDIFAIQAEVAQKIAAALEATLSPLELEHIAKEPTDNVDAYAYYLRGREYYYKYTRDDNERAIELFRKALASDSSYALAYAGLGDAYERRYTIYGMQAGWADSAIASSTHALSLDPDLAEGYKALGNAYYAKEQLRRALEMFTKAVRLNPNYAPAVNNVGWVNWALGSYDEALLWMRKAAVLQPGFVRWTANVGLQYYMLGYDSLSQVWFRKALDLQSDYIFPYVILGYLHLFEGNLDSARTSVARALSIDAREYLALDAAGDMEMVAKNFRGARSYYEKSVAFYGEQRPSAFKLAFVLDQLHKKKESKRLASLLISQFGDTVDSWPEGSTDIPYALAALYAWQQDTTSSIRWLDKAIELGYRDYQWISVDPQFEPMRQNALFQQRVTLLRTSYEKMRAHVTHEGLDK